MLYNKKKETKEDHILRQLIRICNSKILRRLHYEQQ